MANYDPRDPAPFLRAAFERLGREPGMMRFDLEGPAKNDMEMRTREYRLCGCGDPACSMGPPETQEAYRRGEISERDRANMVSTARSRPGGFGGDGPPFSYRVAEPPSSPPMYASAFEPEDEEIAKLDELRDAVDQWIVEAPAVGFDDIKGNEEALEALKDAIRAPVEEKELYELYDMTMPKGALLSGPPGCGKTMFAKAAAHEMSKLYDSEVEMISISGSSIQAPFVGVTEKYIQAIFAFARQYRKVKGHPLLVFIDEAEVLFPDRTGRVRKVAPWEESQVATFLAEMDGMEECGAFVLLASNRPEVIDSALLRDGRCDFKIKVERPNVEALEAILKRNFAGIFTAEKEETLVFHAVEGFLDPHRVLLDFHDMVRSLEDFFRARGFEVKDEASMKKLSKLKTQRFMFEHIVNGAMAASVPMRAKRKAFARDRRNKTELGVLPEDVTAAVADIFEENKELEHAYALQEFLKKVDAELKELG